MEICSDTQIFSSVFYISEKFFRYCHLANFIFPSSEMKTKQNSPIERQQQIVIQQSFSIHVSQFPLHVGSTRYFLCGVNCHSLLIVTPRSQITHTFQNTFDELILMYYTRSSTPRISYMLPHSSLKVEESRGKGEKSVKTI